MTDLQSPLVLGCHLLAAADAPAATVAAAIVALPVRRYCTLPTSAAEHMQFGTYSKTHHKARRHLTPPVCFDQDVKWS